MEKIKILLVDDHPIVRNGVKDSVKGEASFEIIAESESGEKALLLAAELKPDILITDISMDGMNGISLCEEIHAKDIGCKVIFLTMHKDPVYVTKAFEAGAMAYLPKESTDDELRSAIMEVYSGRKYFNEFTAKVLAERFVGKSKEFDTELTPREHEILSKIVDGYSNKEIASLLVISDRTVDSHRTNIMRKLNARNTADMVRTAIRRKLV